MRNQLKTLRMTLAVVLLLGVLVLVALLDISRWPVHPRFTLPTPVPSQAVQPLTIDPATKTPASQTEVSTPRPNDQKTPRDAEGRKETIYAQPQPIDPKTAELAEVHLKDWIAAWKAVAPEFEIRRLKKFMEGYLREDPYAFDTSRLNERRRSLYVFSPDGTRFLDPYGGMHLVEENGRLITAFDDYSAVNLFDLKTSQAQRLVFCGTACLFEDAVWISDNLIAVVGRTEDCETSGQRCGWVPMLVLIDLSRNRTSFYKTLELKPLRGFDYFRTRLKQRLPEIHF